MEQRTVTISKYRFEIEKNAVGVGYLISGENQQAEYNLFHMGSLRVQEGEALPQGVGLEASLEGVKGCQLTFLGDRFLLTRSAGLTNRAGQSQASGAIGSKELSRYTGA